MIGSFLLSLNAKHNISIDISSVFAGNFICLSIISSIVLYPFCRRIRQGENPLGKEIPESSPGGGQLSAYRRHVKICRQI